MGHPRSAAGAGIKASTTLKKKELRLFCGGLLSRALGGFTDVNGIDGDVRLGCRLKFCVFLVRGRRLRGGVGRGCSGSGGVLRGNGHSHLGGPGRLKRLSAEGGKTLKDSMVRKVNRASELRRC